MNVVDIAGQDEVKPFSIQTEIIRRIQVKDGLTPCYATPASDQCNNMECGWRHDCYNESHKCG